MERKHQEFIENIAHGNKAKYQTLRALQKAVDFKARVPKSFIHSEDGKCIREEFGIEITKQAVKETRKELISEIADVILNQKTTEYDDEMMPDNYSRLFHALAILKLEKETELFPGTTDNYMYNASYMLWRLDDGSEQTKKTIESAMWFMSEEIKGRSGETKSTCSKGIKC